MKLSIVVSLLSSLAIANGKVVCTSITVGKVEVNCPAETSPNTCQERKGSFLDPKPDPCCVGSSGLCDIVSINGNSNDYQGTTCSGITCLNGCVAANSDTVCNTVSDDATTSAPTPTPVVSTPTSSPVICSGDAFGSAEVLCPTGKECSAHQGVCFLSPHSVGSNGDTFKASGSGCKLWCCNVSIESSSRRAIVV
eukprot:scaffold16488_cov48-Attheya_sp.AAC.1